MKLLTLDQRGLAPVAILLVIIVLGGAGFAGYRVMQKQNDNTGSSNSQQSVANIEAEKECKKLYNDDDLCKFVSRFNAGGSFKSTFNTTSKDGKTSNMTFEQDGKSNTSLVSKEGDKEVAAYISVNGDTYMKDYTDGAWLKYPKSPDAPANDKPTDDLKIQTKEEESKPEADRTVYKKIGKEKCGDANCFKYQIIDPKEPNTESLIWFGDKDYQLRKWSHKDVEGTTSVGEFIYTNVNISVPSPVKDAAAGMPSQAEMQQALEQAQQYTQ